MCVPVTGEVGDRLIHGKVSQSHGFSCGQECPLECPSGYCPPCRELYFRMEHTLDICTFHSSQTTTKCQSHMPIMDFVRAPIPSAMWSHLEASGACA